MNYHYSQNSSVIQWLKSLTLESTDVSFGLGSAIHKLCDLRQVTEHPNLKLTVFSILIGNCNTGIYPYEDTMKLLVKCLARLSVGPVNKLHSTNVSHLSLNISKNSNLIFRKGNENSDDAASIIFYYYY